MTIEFRAQVTLEKLEKLVDHLRPYMLLKLIGLRLTEHITRQFETRGEGKWKPLAPSTLALRKRGGDAPLQDTGVYRGSFTGQPNGGPAPRTNNVSYVEVGSADYRAAWHEHGTGPFTIPATKKVKAALMRNGQWMHFGKKAIHHPGIPARPVLPNKQVLENLVQSEVQSYMEIVNASG